MLEHLLGPDLGLSERVRLSSETCSFSVRTSPPSPRVWSPMYTGSGDGLAAGSDLLAPGCAADAAEGVEVVVDAW